MFFVYEYYFVKYLIIGKASYYQNIIVNLQLLKQYVGKYVNRKVGVYLQPTSLDADVFTGSLPSSATLLSYVPVNCSRIEQNMSGYLRISFLNTSFFNSNTCCNSKVRKYVYITCIYYNASITICTLHKRGRPRHTWWNYIRETYDVVVVC